MMLGLVLLSLAAAPPALVEEPLVPGRPFVLRGHTDGVQLVAFSPDGARLVSLGRDRQLRLWDARTGEKLASLELPGQPSAVAFSADGTQLAVGSVELQVFLVDLAKAAVTQIVAHPDVVSEVAFSPDGASLAVAGASDTGYVYRLADPDKKVAFRGRSAGYAADGKTLLVANGAGTLATFDAATAKLRKTLSAKEEKARAAQSQDGKVIVSWSPVGGEVKVWSPAGKPLSTLAPPPAQSEEPGPRVRLTAVALSRDGGRVLAASTDGAVRLWAVVSKVVLATWPIANAPSVALSPDGAWVAVADGALVKLWKAP